MSPLTSKPSIIRQHTIPSTIRQRLQATGQLLSLSQRLNPRNQIIKHDHIRRHLKRNPSGSNSGSRSHTTHQTGAQPHA